VTRRREIPIEGYTPEEFLAMPAEDIDAFVFCGRPLVFRAGSAEILGEFRKSDDTLILELAEIEGGGEGVLPMLTVLARRYALREGLAKIEWRVHAVHCADPNLKLRRVLERRGFQIKDIPGSGECYFFVSNVEDAIQ
jgi:hypothetical protein